MEESPRVTRRIVRVYMAARVAKRQSNGSELLTYGAETNGAIRKRDRTCVSQRHRDQVAGCKGPGTQIIALAD